MEGEDVGMGAGRKAGLARVAMLTAAVGGSAVVARAAGPMDAVPGVLDRLTAPSVPLVDRLDGRATSQPVQADPIPAPTPTAATVGLVTLCGMAVWRSGRRVLG